MAVPTVHQRALDRVMYGYRIYVASGRPLSQGTPSPSFLNEATRVVELTMQTPTMRVTAVNFLDATTVYIATDRGFLSCFRYAELTHRSYQPNIRWEGLPHSVDLSLNDREFVRTLSTF